MRAGIAVKINGIVLLVVLALGAALALFYLREQRATLVAERERRIRITGVHYAHAVEYELSRANLEGVDRILKGAALDEEVAYVIVKSASGGIVAARWTGGRHGDLAEHLFPLRRLSPTAPSASAAVPFGRGGVAEGKDDAGTLAVGVDSSLLESSLARLLWKTLVAVLLFALLASAAGFFFVRLLLRRSVLPLISGIREVSAGNLSHRLRMDTGDELGEVGRAFDAMAEELSGTLVSREDLRREVDARTAELRETLDERIRMQDGLAEREERIRLLLESTAEAIVGVAGDGKCTFCNPACLRLLGLSGPREVIGKDVHALLHGGDGGGAGHSPGDCPILSVLRGGTGVHVEEDRLARGDGTPLEADLWSYPVRRGEDVTGAVVTFLDVSERRRLEGELLKMKNLESIGILAGGIAHDFNNFLAGILGNVSLARSVGGLPPEADERLERAEKASLHARDLTRQLLTFSKGGLPVKKVVSVGRLVRETVEFVLSGSRTVGRFDIPPGLSRVEADEGQMNQLFQNLAINAVQAMPEGGTLRVSCSDAVVEHGSPLPLPPGRYVRVAVRDEGVGIPRENLGRIFDPYFSTKETGTGLGLATVYSIVRKHGGHVSVSSEPGKGTEFEVLLPATSKRGEAASPLAASGRGDGRILVMDDDELVREVAAHMLEQGGYRAECVADGRDAVSAFRHARDAGAPFSAVLLDLTVPGGMGGEEALVELRKVDPDVRAIVTSGYSHSRVVADYRAHGFRGRIAKPYRLQELFDVLAEVLAPAGRVETAGIPPGGKLQ
jgi:PAS domain S-box-containing protein